MDFVDAASSSRDRDHRVAEGLDARGLPAVDGSCNVLIKTAIGHDLKRVRRQPGLALKVCVVLLTGNGDHRFCASQNFCYDGVDIHTASKVYRAVIPLPKLSVRLSIAPTLEGLDVRY